MTIGTAQIRRTTLLDIEQARAGCQVAIRPAPTSYPVLDAEEAEVPMRDVWSNLRQMAALDGANTVLGDECSAEGVIKALRGLNPPEP